MKFQPGWIRQVFDTLHSSGVITGRNSDENYLINKLVDTHKLDQNTHSVSKHIMEVDKALPSCTGLNKMECALKKCMGQRTNRVAEPYDFYADDKNVATQLVGKVLSVEKIQSIVLLSHMGIEGKSCQGCYLRYRLEVLIERMSHVELPMVTCLEGVPKEKKYVMIGMKKISERRLPDGKNKDEKQKVKRMVALGVRVKDKKYILCRPVEEGDKSKEDKGNTANKKGNTVNSKGGKENTPTNKDLFMMELEDFIYKGGFLNREVFGIKTIVRKPSEIQKLLEDPGLVVETVEVDRIYGRKESSNELVNIFGENSKEYERLYKEVYPEDHPFENIRRIVNRKPGFERPKKKKKKKEEEGMMEFVMEEWMKVGISGFLVFLLVIVTIMLVRPSNESQKKKRRLQETGIFS